MDAKSNIVETGVPIGFSSHLRRHGAVLANQLNCSRNEFITTLAECYQNLGIEGRAVTPDDKIEDNGEDYDMNDTKIEWQNLQCPKCHRQFGNTSVLVNHFVDNHGKQKDKIWYYEFHSVGHEFKNLLNKATKKQAENSYVKKKFANSQDLLVCPVDSPLTPYLMMRNLRVYFEVLPENVSEGIAVNMQVANSSYTVIFAFQKLERVRRRIKKSLAKKKLTKRLIELERHCARSWIAENDIVFKKNRTVEESRALAQALRLPATSTHNDIIKKVNEMKVKHDEMNSSFSNVYSNNVKADGQMMSTEEKRLISSLTNGMMTPVCGKRKTTYKNPSELIIPKKRLKTSE